LNEPPFFDYCLALGRYEFPLQELISQFKFNAKLSAGRALSLALLHEILSNLRKDPPEAFLPVPLHRKRIRNRGFNQSTEIAKLLAKHSQAPLLEDYCYRKRVTAPQRGLSASARANNLNGAFAIKKTHERWQHIAIVDDVVTTKSTVNAIAQLLKQEGVKKVGVICLARVSEPSRTDI
jgi:ComF family protein